MVDEERFVDDVLPNVGSLSVLAKDNGLYAWLLKDGLEFQLP